MSEGEFSAVDFTKMDALSKRFFSDIYMCIYQCPDRSMKSVDRQILVNKDALQTVLFFPYFREHKIKEDGRPKSISDS